MANRSNKPSAIPISPSFPQPLVSISADNSRVKASLPAGDSVEILLYGATVISWKASNGKEQLFLSDKAKLDGSKAVRGGIPLVFPLFGPASSSHEATSKLPQHGFARSSRWEYLGKSSSESLGSKGGPDNSVTLDFGLSEAMLDGTARQAWPYAFGLTYSVTLGPNELGTSLQVQNTGEQAWEFQTLLHTYFRVDDIAKTAVTGLESIAFLDKVPQPKQADAANEALEFTGETDRVYADAEKSIAVTAGGKPVLEIRREGLGDVVVWNPWTEKAKGISDLGPEDGWKRMVCVEAGTVKGWTKLEGGDRWEGRQVVKAL